MNKIIYNFVRGNHISAVLMKLLFFVWENFSKVSRLEVEEKVSYWLLTEQCVVSKIHVNNKGLK